MATRCLRLAKILEKADNDSDKFAALLLVPKSLEVEKLSLQEKKNLFKSIGFNFVLRLLHTATDSKLINNIGICILSSFSEVGFSNSQIKEASEKILSLIASLQLDNLDEVDLVTLKEACKMLNVFLSCADHTNFFSNSSVAVASLSTVVCSVADDEVIFNSLNVISCLLNGNSKLWHQCNRKLLTMLKQYTIKINLRKDQDKFQMMKHFSRLISNFDSDYQSLYLDKWLETSKEILHEVFSSKLSSSNRNIAIDFCSQLVYHFGLSSLINKEDKFRNVNCLLIRLICIEMGLVLNQSEDNLSQSDIQLLLSCLPIYEAYCSTIADFDQSQDQDENLLSFSQIKLIQGQLTDVAKLIVSKLHYSLNQSATKKPILLACFRALSSWMNVEYFCHLEETIKFVPIYISYLKKTISLDINMVKVISPVVINLCEIPASLTYLDSEQVFNCLFMELCDSKQCLDKEGYPLLVQALMALALRVEIDGTQNQLLLKLIQQTTTQKKNFINYTYVSTLLLIILNKQKNLCVDEKTENFFKNLISFLQVLHSTNGKGVYVSKRYDDCWNEIEGLWPILMKEFSLCISSKFVSSEDLKQSGFCEKVTDLLKVFRKLDDTISDFAFYYNVVDSAIQTVVSA